MKGWTGHNDPGRGGGVIESLGAQVDAQELGGLLAVPGDLEENGKADSGMNEGGTSQTPPRERNPQAQTGGELAPKAALRTHGLLYRQTQVPS